MTPPPETPLPDGWRLAKLGDVAEVVMGQSPPGSTVVDWTGQATDGVGLPFLQGNAEFTARFPQPTKWCVSPQKVAESGDVLISVRAPVGETNRADQRLAIGRGLAALRFVRSTPPFGWHLLNAAKSGVDRVTQGSTFAAIGGADIRALPILLPPLHEQRRIAEVLDSIDEAIERAESVITSTEQLRDALLHELLTKGVPNWHTEWKDAPNIGQIPACWEVARLGDVCKSIEDGDWIESKDQGGNDYRLLQLSNIGIGEFVETGTFRWITQETFDRLRCTEINIGDVLVARMPDPIGRAFRVSRLSSPAITAVDIAIIRTKTASLSSEYLSYYFNSAKCMPTMAGLATGTTRKRIRRSDIALLPIPLPPLPEQRAIAGTLDEVESAIKLARTHVQWLKLTQDSVADALLTGRVRVAGK